MTIVEFLHAQLDEDQATAEKAREIDGVGEVIGYVEYLSAAAQAGEEHINRFDPDRVLREVEAKRVIVEMHRPRSWHEPLGRGIDCTGCHEPVGLDGACTTLRQFALPYADHPNYDPAWRP